MTKEKKKDKKESDIHELGFDPNKSHGYFMHRDRDFDEDVLIEYKIGTLSDKAKKILEEIEKNYRYDPETGISYM